MDGCRDFRLGDKFAVFSLSVDDLTEEGGALGRYDLTLTSADGKTTVSVPEITVTGRGMIQTLQNLQ